ncbi:MAG: 3-deoxy-D-manno-octulosonic acid transferase, partial [Acidobacteriota bacterium]
KFDASAEPLPELEAQIRRLAGERPILVAGSTHPPEDPHILDAFERLGHGRALLVLAPRGRAEPAESLLRDRGIPFVRRSQLPASESPAVVLLDTQGELASLYRLAAAAFIGNSLMPEGSGHNPIEPAGFAIPIAVGPHMTDFKLQADLFDRAGAWQRIADARELAQAWSLWLDTPELARQIGRRAADLVEAQRGLATSKTWALLRPFLELEETVTSPTGAASRPG